jgi:hypothetical protein
MSDRVRHCIEATNIVLIDEATVAETEQWVAACEHCAENVSIAFDYILDAITGSDPESTEYLMCRTGRCPFCSGAITEKTLVAVGGSSK